MTKTNKSASIFGILNVTKDSFSDGGLYLNPEDAILHAQRLKADGADILDIGACSTHPDSEQVSAKEEIARLKPVLDVLNYKTSISIDSYNSETQEWALKEGVGFLNDTSGFENSSILEMIASYPKTKLIVMHSIQPNSGQATKDHGLGPKEVFKGIIKFFEERLSQFQKYNISLSRVILDPGMGFFLGTNPQNSIYVLNNIDLLKKEFSLPVFISVSRKSFIQKSLKESANNLSSACAYTELYATEKGADYIRTHEPKNICQMLKMKDILGCSQG